MSNPRNGKVTHADELSKNEEVKEKRNKRKRKIEDEVPQQALSVPIEEQIDEEEVEDVRKSKRRKKNIVVSPEPTENFSKATSAASSAKHSKATELTTSTIDIDDDRVESEADPSIPKKFGTPKFDLSSLPPIEAREFVAEDFDRLTENEYNRFIDNSNKIGHAVIMKNSQGQDVALQYHIPAGEKEETPNVRPLVNIEAIEKYGMKKYRAQTPDTQTIMYAKRFIDAEFTADKDNTGNPEKLRIACFSPSPNAKEPFWGGKDKSTTIFKEFSKKSKQKELEAERKEIGTIIKGGDELLVHGPSVKVRDDIKVRNPDQNMVMGESARDAYENFFNMLTDELDADVKKIIKRAFDAKLNTWYGNYRPEWLHLYGFGLTPGNMDPQNTNNLGAAGKWCNTEMMILERIAKWFALNQPDVFIKIKPRFEMVLDSEVVKKINFEVTLEDKKHFLRFIQEIDPFKEWPLFRKASDIAQGTAIAHSLMHDVPPVSNDKIKNGSTSKPIDSAGKQSYALASEAPVQAATATHVTRYSPTSAFKPISSSAAANKMLKSASSSSSECDLQMPTHFKYEKSLVQIFTTSQIANYDIPWSATEIQTCRGSGSVIRHEGKLYVLTNAHVVQDSVVIRLRLANDKKKKYEAKCKCVSYQSDLALLEVTDPEFQKIAKPVELGEMVSLQDSVKTIGFPIGGTEISVTEGIVSRIEVRDYCMSGLAMLMVQVDSAINYGNSGGPVFSNGKQVGVAFQGNDFAQLLGYMIPMPIVRHFLTEVFSNKPYRGYPILPVSFQTLENESLRRFYGLKDNQSGIRVEGVDFLTDAKGKLFPDDILLEIDSLPISNEGTVDIPDVGECLDFIHVTHMKFVGDIVKLKVLRKNNETNAFEIKNLEVILDHAPLETEKVPQTEHDKMPTYYICSGISFTPLTRNYMEGRGSDLEEFYSIEHACSLINMPKKSEDEQIIVVNDILDCKATEGYEDYVNAIIKEVNGKAINNMNDLVNALENNKDEMHVITTASKKKIVIKRMTKEEHEKLLKTYHIKSDRSEDLISTLSTVPTSACLSSVAPAVVAATVSHNGPVPMEIDGDSGDEEEEKVEEQELTAADLPGYRKYRAKLDQMDNFYGQYQLGEDEDLDEENDEDYSEEDEDEDSYESDASEDLTAEKENASVVKFTSRSSAQGFFKKRNELSGVESEDGGHVPQRRFK